ncbi:MAG: arylsulfatase [Rhizobiaceae bacterium]
MLRIMVGLLFIICSTVTTNAQEKPNIVLVFMDNFGYGELGTYGGGVLRGAPTPRIDSLAEEGMKLLNFNVEAQCTPSRAAIMTGRYAVRTGNASVPLSTTLYGLTQWEHTMPEMLAEAGYTTGMFGKWHLGDTEGRFPTDQGFDEWYGIPNSTDEAFWNEGDNPRFRRQAHPLTERVYSLMEGRKGAPPKSLRPYNLEERRLIDRELTDRSIDFMKRHAKDNEPFFLFIPYTQTHLPVEPHPDFLGKTGKGPFADVLAQLDTYVGDLLDAVDELGIRDNTIFIFTADNGPEMLVPYHGTSGPWSGTYFTGREGSLRVPFLIRWPGKIPAGAVSNEIVHEMDLYTTFAKWAGGKVPTDRIIDGVDQSEFFEGASESSNREAIVVYVGNQVFGVKWRNWKMMFQDVAQGAGEPRKMYDFPLFYDLHTDMKEEHPFDDHRFIENAWVRWPAGKVLTDHMESLKKEPPVPPGTPDPYTPDG